MRLIIRLLAIATLVLTASRAVGAVILQYHHVDADTPAATSVTPEQFESHLQRLAEEGFRVIPLDELVTRVRDGLDPREKVAAITFDDGYRSVYRNALPMLEKRGWTAAVFVATEGVREGWREMMSPAMLAELHERGHLVLNHTRSHPHMVRRREGESQAQWLERMRREVQQAQDQLTEWLGEAPPRYLAWPYGESVPELHELSASLGYVAFGQQTGALGPHTDWQLVPRVAINRHYADWDDLEHKVTALPLPVTATIPDNGVTEQPRPPLTLELAGDWTGRVNCFASGKPARVSTELDAGSTILSVRSESDLSPGRHRYNCTAGAGEGRFHWYSWMWMRKPVQGWYPEP